MLSPVGANLLAIGILLLLGTFLAVGIFRHFRYSPFTTGQTLLYDVNLLLSRVLWRARVTGQFPVPDGQGAIILLNHRCPFDPSSLYLTTKRIVRWMVAREYCENPSISWFFKASRSIPVGRGGIDTAAIKQAIRYTQQGELIGLFPEGRINTTDQILLSGRPGAAMIALKAKVPVVPCFLSGSPYDGTIWGCFFMPAKIHLRIGPLIDLSEYYGQEGNREILEQLTKRFLREMATLAGQPDFEPQVAGRFYKPS